MGKGFEILVWAIFPQMYLWIQDKYSSIRFNSVNSRKGYFNTINFQLIWTPYGRSGCIAEWFKAGLFSLEEVGMQVQIPAWQLPVFFLPFRFLLSSLTAGPVSFARFLRKRISFSSFNNVLVLLCVFFLTYMCCPRLCSHGGWLLLKYSAIGIGFNGAETNCGIVRILGILLMNSWDT